MFDQTGVIDREPITRKSGVKTTWLWVAALATLSVCVIMSVWFPLLSIGSLPSRNYNEGWNAYRQWMAAEGYPLYAQKPTFWITNYPLLSFHIVGLLGAAIGNMVLAGRIIAMVSLAVIAVLAGGIVRVAAGSMRAGVYAGLCLFLWIATFTPDRRAMDDPELLGVAIATFGLFAYVKAPKSALWSGLSALAFAVSIFVKVDLIAFPLSVGVHLVVTRNWRALFASVAVGIVATGLLLILTYSLDGPYFFENLLQPRAYIIRNLAEDNGHYLLHFGVPLVLCTILAIRNRNVQFGNFLFSLLIVTYATAIYFSGGDGVDDNIFYQPMITVVITCAVAICSLERLPQTLWPNKTFITALFVPVLSGVVFVPLQLHKDLVTQQHLPTATKAAQNTITLLKSVDGPVICEDILLCYESGKPLDYDPYFVKDQISIGRLKESDVLAMLISHHYAAIEINGIVNPTQPLATKRGRFTKAFMQTLFGEYRPVLTDGIYTVFEPRE
jgi:hypothetical protein